MIDFDIRLKCEHSIAIDDAPELLCEVTGEMCDGVYLDICQPEKCYFVGGVCCYPIDDCENCPNRTGYYMPMTRAVIE